MAAFHVWLSLTIEASDDIIGKGQDGYVSFFLLNFPGLQRIVQAARWVGFIQGGSEVRNQF